MKLVMSTGGLGNQMFGYALVVRLSKDNKSFLFHPYNKHSSRYGHEGFQIEDIFEQSPEDKEKSIKLFLLVCYWNLTRVFLKKYRPKLLKIIGLEEFSVGNFVFDSNVLTTGTKDKLFMGTWQSEKYFIEVEQEVRKALVFREELLNAETVKIKETQQKTGCPSDRGQPVFSYMRVRAGQAAIFVIYWYCNYDPRVSAKRRSCSAARTE